MWIQFFLSFIGGIAVGFISGILIAKVNDYNLAAQRFRMKITEFQSNANV